LLLEIRNIQDIKLGVIKFISAIEKQLKKTAQELEGVHNYPIEDLVSIIKEVGFKCDLCAMCCTRKFNDHVFLLNADANKMMNNYPEMLEPAPYYELCDQHGHFYVSGYALKVQSDGSCVFLKDDRCTIYEKRPDICRIYPYMLHREADEDGNIQWRQISGLNQHGCYHSDIDEQEAAQIATQIKTYETAYLTQLVTFFKIVTQHFKNKGLRHVQGVYDREMRKFFKGGEITVFVFFNGKLLEYRISKH